jgi:hypothetical protein
MMALLEQEPFQSASSRKNFSYALETAALLLRKTAIAQNSQAGKLFSCCCSSSASTDLLIGVQQSLHCVEALSA